MGRLFYLPLLGEGWGEAVLIILVPRMLCLFAKWQVSWLLPGSASSQEVVPVTFRCAAPEGNYSSGHCSGLPPDSLST